jgi:hypothetical protein
MDMAKQVKTSALKRRSEPNHKPETEPETEPEPGAELELEVEILRKERIVKYLSDCFATLRNRAYGIACQLQFTLHDLVSREFSTACCQFCHVTWAEVRGFLLIVPPTYDGALDIVLCDSIFPLIHYAYFCKPCAITAMQKVAIFQDEHKRTSRLFADWRTGVSYALIVELDRVLLRHLIQIIIAYL